MTENQTTTELDPTEAAPAATLDDETMVHVPDAEPLPTTDADPDAVAEVNGDAADDELVSAAGGDEFASTPGDDEESPFGGEEGVLSGVEVVVDDETMRRALEAILMVTDEPLPVLTLARTVGRPTGDVTNALNELAGEYTEQGRGFDLREVGGGWRYYTRAEAAQYVERFVLDGQQSRLTQAALETLAVVAYKQPVSRARVSAIRGVNVDGVMRTLVSRGLVEEAGSDTESQATLYRTTSYFLERMGMQSLDDLPELAPYLPDMDDMEDELAAQNAPAPDAAEATEATESSDAAVAASEAGASESADGGSETAENQPVAEDEGAGGELEPAEELEAGGGEIEPDVDPAEIPAVEEDADGNDDEGADFDAAEGDPEDDAADFDAATGDPEDLEDGTEADDFDEDDESADEQLQAAEDLEAAGAPEGFGEEPVADDSQYGTEANDRDE